MGSNPHVGMPGPELINNGSAGVEAWRISNSLQIQPFTCFPLLLVGWKNLVLAKLITILLFTAGSSAFYSMSFIELLNEQLAVTFLFVKDFHSFSAPHYPCHSLPYTY